jgi:hypothetical protein
MAMKKSRFLLVSSLCVLSAFGSASALAFPVCSRVITNKSTSPWTISAKTTAGDLYFTNGCPMNGPCTILPNQSVTVGYSRSFYGRGDYEAVGYLTFKAKNGTSHSYFYHGTNSAICPEIVDHYTGIQMNRPQDGDAVIWING